MKAHDDRFQTIHIIDLYHSLQRMEENQYDIVYRILLDNDYRRLLSQAGFTDIKIYGDYDRNPLRCRQHATHCHSQADELGMEYGGLAT